MSLEPLGIIAALLGLAMLLARPYWSFLIMALCTILGTGMAINLPALGGAGILVPNFFLVFFMLRILLATGPGPVLASAIPLRPGFWLLILTAFGVLTAFFLPRLFAGVTETISVTRVFDNKSFISASALGPTSTNITQAVYAIGGCLAFAFSFAYTRFCAKPTDILKTFLIVGLVNIAMAALDIITYYTGTGFILDSVRTANYDFLTANEMGGLKRIAGTFSEASAFASYTLPLFAFAASLWLDKTRHRMAGLVAALLLAALVLSTSATALAGLILVTAVLLARTVISGLQRPEMTRSVWITVGALVCVTALLALPVIAPTTASDWINYIKEVLVEKPASSSGQERMLWNLTALQNFIDTNWIGAGLGSARASSFPLVLLSNLGIAGFLLFALFAWSILSGRTGWHEAGTEPELDLARTARAAKACFMAVLITSTISAAVYDLGLTVYLIGGRCSGTGLRPESTAAAYRSHPVCLNPSSSLSRLSISPVVSVPLTKKPISTPYGHPPAQLRPLSTYVSIW